MSVNEDVRQTTKTATQTASPSAELQHAKMLIDGEWVGSASGATLTVENPAKRAPIATIPRGDAADVSGAVEAAERAFPAWSRVAPRDRGRLLLRIADKMEAEAEDKGGVEVVLRDHFAKVYKRAMPPELVPLAG